MSESKLNLIVIDFLQATLPTAVAVDENETD